MEEGVAYMMMGEGGEGVQPTQLVALQSEDGTQQLAVPVIDPNTGQETYMILDQNSLEGEDGQQLLIVGEGDNAQLIQTTGADAAAIAVSTEAAEVNAAAAAGLGVQVATSGAEFVSAADSIGIGEPGATSAYTLGEDQNGEMLMIPSSLSTTLTSNGEENTTVMYVPPGDLQHTEQEPELTQLTPQTVIKNEDCEQLNGSGISVPHKQGGMIHVVGVRQDKPSIQIQENKQQNRQPRKQQLSANSDYSQDKPASGLSGDIIKDTVLVDSCVDMVSKRITLSASAKEQLRTNIMTHGIDYAQTFLNKERLSQRAKRLSNQSGGGRGISRSKYGPRGAIGRPKGRPPKRAAMKARVIKCDQCNLEFPAEIEEYKLIQHIERFHLKPAAPAPEPTLTAPSTPPPPSTNSYLDPEMPIGPQRYSCCDCNQSFSQIKTLLDHQKEAHSRDTEVRKESPASPVHITRLPESPSTMSDGVDEKPKADVKYGEDDGEEEEEELEPSLAKRPRLTNENKKQEDLSESPSKQKMDVMKKLADEWDDDDELDDQGEETLSEGVPRELLDSTEPAPSLSQPSQGEISSSAFVQQQADGLESRDGAHSAGGGITNGRRLSMDGSEASETLENISKEVAGIRQDTLSQEAYRTSCVSGTGVKREDEDEASIVADVDDILSDTDKLITSVSSILTEKALKRNHERVGDAGLMTQSITPTANSKSLLKGVPEASRSKVSSSPKQKQSQSRSSSHQLMLNISSSQNDEKADMEEEESVAPLLSKKPTVQCDECYECFEDEEKLAWHNLNDH